MASRTWTVLVILVGVSLLGACSTDDTPEASAENQARAATAAVDPAEEVEVLSGQAAQNGSVLEGLVAEFNGSGAGTEVDLELTNQTDAETLQRVQAALAAGDPPDLVRVTPTTLGALVATGAARPVDVCLDGDPGLRNDLVAELLDTGRVDGTLYAWPWYSTVPALFYDADRFREVGLDPDRPPSTYSEMEAAAARVAASASGRFGVVLYGGNDYAFQGPLFSLGGAMVDRDGTAPAFDGAAGAEVLGFWRRLVERELMPFYANPFAEAAESFARREVAMYVNSSANYPQVAAGAGFDVRMAPMPVPDGADRAVVPASTNGFALLADEPAAVEAACRFLRYLVSEPAVATTVRETATVPLNRAAEDELGPFFAERPDFVAVNAQQAVPWFTFPGASGTEFQRAFTDAQTLALTGRARPEEALAELASKATAFLRSSE